MDFAKRMLEKYGWSQGQGLGKHGTGMTEALKPKRKLNQFGLGHDTSGKMSEEFTYRWWEDAYNEASRNVIVGKAEDGLKMEIVDQDAFQISAVKRSKIKRDKAKYGSFLKRETLAENCVTSEPVLENEPQELSVALPPTLSDEQLFQACGGLTAHKGARHGLTLSGKLKRVREQEEALLRALQQNQSKEFKKPSCKELKLESEMLEREPSKKSKSEKKKKSETQAVCEDLAETCGNETTEKEKKKKRKLENQNVEEGKLSNGEEHEQKESKKSKKKRRHQTSETFYDDSAVTSVNNSDNTDSEKKQRKRKKDKNGCKDYVHEVQELSQLAHLDKKNKKKRRKTEEAGS